MNTTDGERQHQHHQGDEHHAGHELADERRADAQEHMREHPSEAIRLTRVGRALDKAHAGVTRASRTCYAAALC